MSTDSDLVKLTRSYAQENRVLSWWYVTSAFFLLFSAITVVLYIESTLLRLCISVLISLLFVRTFILYHDFYHRAILRKSRIASVLFWVHGLLILTPPNTWKETHNFHHAHTAVPEFSNIGSFRIMSTDEWKKTFALQKLLYIVQRHPMTIALGYFTVFLYGMCIQGFLRKPAKNWDGLLAIGVNAGLLLGAYMYNALEVIFFAWFLPSIISAAIGSYLFYAQHNFPGVDIRERKGWSYIYAALHSTSYIEMSPIMSWFTGNIGYHHIHHVNHQIPFYRLPETMADIPAFQSPHTTTLQLNDIINCFRLDLWDTDKQQMVSFHEFTKSQ